MKKICLVILLLGLFHFDMKAQGGFAPERAEWWYYSEDEFGSQGVMMLLHARAGGDTTISGQPCRIIRQEGISKGVIYPLPPASGPGTVTKADTVPFRSLFVYSTTDTVFLYNELFGRFTPLYILNVTPGDTLCLPAIPDVYNKVSFVNPALPAGTDSMFCMIIDSVQTVVYNGTPLRTVFSHALFDEGVSTAQQIIENWGFASYNAPGIYAETIGGVHGGILPKPQYFRGIFDGFEPTANMDLNCYSDPGLSIKLSASDCDYIRPTTAIRALKPDEVGISLSPNPVTGGQLNLSLRQAISGGLELMLFDLAGKTLETRIFSGHAGNECVYLSQYPSGIYLCRISGGGGQFYQKIVIRH